MVKQAEVNAKDNYDQTPWHLAAANGRLDVTELLLAEKVEVNAKADNGRTPLHMAALNGQNDVVELLRQHGRHQ